MKRDRREVNRRNDIAFQDLPPSLTYVDSDPRTTRTARSLAPLGQDSKTRAPSPFLNMALVRTVGTPSHLSKLKY